MNEKEIQIVQAAIGMVKERFKEDSTGHDVSHMMRVFNNAKKIQKEEGGNLFIISMAALFHDFPDKKLTEDPVKEYQSIRKWMQEKGIPAKDIEHILRIIRSVSYREGNNPNQPDSLEAEIVQDADRLDAIGAIGIARTFAYGGSSGQKMYDLENLNGPNTIQHFYDKLLKLKDLMQTETGKMLAKERDQYMRDFLKQFRKEMTFGENY